MKHIFDIQKHLFWIFIFILINKREIISELFTKLVKSLRIYTKKSILNSKVYNWSNNNTT